MIQTDRAGELRGERIKSLADGQRCVMQETFPDITLKRINHKTAPVYDRSSIKKLNKFSNQKNSLVKMYFLLPLKKHVYYKIAQFFTNFKFNPQSFFVSVSSFHSFFSS